MATVRIPLVGNPTFRDNAGTKDQVFINCYPEVLSNPLTQDPHYFLVKRPGLFLNTTVSGATGAARGIYSWKGVLFTVFGTTVYRNGVSIQTLSTSTGKVGFTEASQAGSPILFFCDGVSGYICNTSGTVTPITDPDFPNPHIPSPVAMDGYVFVVKSTTNEIYNSNLQDPLNWLATNFIQAELYPDGIVNIGRQANQFVAFGERSIEFFFDAANANGSPLARSDQLVQQHGLYTRDSLAQAEGIFMWVATSNSGTKYVCYMEGFNIKVVSTEPIARRLASMNSSMYGSIIRWQGQLLYILVCSSATFVYSISTGVWVEWKSTSNNSFDVPWIATDTTGTIYALSYVSPNVYAFSSTRQDNGVNYTMSIRTLRWDGNTTAVKNLQKLEILGDILPTSEQLTVQVTDDDYQTYKPARTFDVSKRMYGWSWGNFRRRAFLISYTGSQALRLEALELEVDQGGL